MYLEISNPMDYHVALYIRLSKEDESEGPSQSVTNQQSLLKRVTYTVEDLKLQLDADRRYREITSLERAMKWIRGNTDGSLKVKEAARKAYLRRLNQNTPKSKFQKEYEASCEYVNACTTKISPGELREKIASRAAAYYGSAFRGAIAIPGYYLHDQNDTWKKSEIDRLIEEHVVRAYSLFYYQFKNYLEFVNGSRTDRDDFAAQIADMAHFAWDNPNAPEDEQAYQYRLTGYLNYLGAVMPKALSHSFILGTPVNVEQQQVLVGHIAELCVQTCEKLGIRVEEWADADRLDTVIIRYNMHGYNLMQAIARVNRVFQDKEGGLVVDYVGIASALKAAMKEYSARDRAKYAADMFYADVTGGHGYEMFYNSKATDGHYWSLDTDKALQCAAYIAKQDGSWQKAKNAEDILSEYAVADESAYEDYARTEWIKQHMDYAASDEFEHEIVGGYNDRMMVVFRDALDDEDIKSYETRKTISAMLNLDVELSEADMYELIIAEILYGERGQHITEEAYNQNLRNSVANVAKVLVNMATSGDTAKEIPSDVLDSINESYELLQTLEFGSEEYGNTYSKFVSLLKGNVKELKSKLKTELADDAAFTGLGIVIDGAFEQYEALEDILSYINNYVAYQSTSKQLHDVLGHLLVVIYMHQGNVQFRFCANIQFVKGTE